MKNINKAMTTTPLRHYPYQGPLTPAESPIPKSELIDEIKKEEMQSPGSYQQYQQQQMHQMQPYSYYDQSNQSTPSVSPSDQHPYACPSARHSTSSSRYSDMPLNHSGPLTYYGNNNKYDDDEDYEQKKEKIQKIQKVPKVQVPAHMKPARKYSQKSENEKNTTEYKQSRARNNEAVRRSRAKTAKAQEEKNKKMEGMAKEIAELNQVIADLQKANLDKGKLIRDVRLALQECHDTEIFEICPRLGDIITFKN